MFLSEKDLVDAIKSNYFNICKWDIEKNVTKILTEVNLGFGIADVVITKVKKNANLSNSKLNNLDITIYQIIEANAGISLNEITKYVGNKGLLRQSIEKLIQTNYIKENDTLFEIFNKYKNCIEDTIAIEAKLKNWKRALNQAYRYKWFASRAFVVLDEKCIASAMKNLLAFKKLNVGLASIKLNGDIKIIFNPKKEIPLNPKMMMQLSEMVQQNYLDNKNDFQIAR